LKNGEQFEIKNLVKIVLVVVIFLALAYFFTDKIMQKENKVEEMNVTYNEAVIGNVLNKKDSAYYVLLYSSKTDKTANYDAIHNAYLESDSTVKLYYVDMNLKVNSAYLSDVSNKEAKSLEELKIKDGTLLKIENGEIVGYYDTIGEIEKNLV